MTRIYLLLGGLLLLLSHAASAMNPLAAVVVPNGQSVTFTGAPNRGTGANTTYNNYYYSSIDIQSGGLGIFNDGENVRVLTVRTGGILRFGVGGEVSSALVLSDIMGGATIPNPTITLEPGAILQLANPNGVPFARGQYASNNSGASGSSTATAYSMTGLGGAEYQFIGTAAQTTAAPADAMRGGRTDVATTSGIALPATVAKLRFQNNGGPASTVTVVNNTSVTQELHITFGRVIVASGATLTTVSSATSTALLDYNGNNGGGSIEGPGTLAVQRYLDGSLNAGTGYRQLTSPMTGATVSSFANGSYVPFVNPAYNTSPSTVPAASFPTVFSYDQTKVTATFDQGWQSPAALTDALVPGRGYTVNTPPTPATGARLTFRGVPNNNFVSVTGLGHTTASGGFHLLGNPFGAPLNWDQVQFALNGLGSALYVSRSTGQYTGTYTVYLPAFNGGRTAAAAATNVVPMGQAFFVYNPTVGSTGSVNFDASQTITTYNATVAGTQVQRPTAETRPYLTLTLQDAAGTYAHATSVYFEAAATPGFDATYDAAYLAGAGQAVAISTELAGQGYAINALPALGTADVVVPLRLAATAAGTYTLAAAELENLPVGTHAYLLDATTSLRQDLATTPSATITLAANASVAGRYSLVFSRSTALATAPAALAQLASLYPNPAHGTTALVLPAALRGQQATPVAIVNSLGQTVRTATQPATADELALPLDGLAPGLYTVQAHTALGTLSRRLVVE